MYLANFRSWLPAMALTILSLCASGAVGITSTQKVGGGTSVFVEVNDLRNRPLPGYVDLVPYDNATGTAKRLSLKDGKVLSPVVPGKYQARVFVYDWDLPIMVHIEDITLQEGGLANVGVQLTEGMGDSLPLRAFDQDFDLVLDRVELAAKTNPMNPSSFPGAEPVPFDSPVLEKKAGWYKGDLHVRSVHGGGVESVAELVARAEKSGLDFIAITDRNTLESVYDANFHSNKVVLIPAMEWGDDERGVALIYGPRTLPAKPSGFKDDQGVCQRVQAQGGIFAIAHPCLDKAPWQRGLGFVNAVQVWCRDWRAMPGITLNSLMDEYQRRVDGNLVYSISLAANTQNLSANGQAAMFWDYELTRGLKAAAIAGSMSANPKVPLGQPMTWVYAQEKSARGILHGLRLGRTMVTAGPDAPFIEFLADANTSKRTINVDLEKGIKKEAVNVNRPDVGLGGVVPLGINVNLMVQVKNANGAKVEILRNGWPIISKKIETDKVDVLQVTERPSSYAVYRARVIRAPQGPGVGPIDILAMTSPIYAQDIIPIDPTKKDPLDVWVKVGNSGLPPAKVSERIEEGGQTRVRFEQGAPIPPVEQDTFEGPQGERVVELKPKPL